MSEEAKKKLIKMPSSKTVIRIALVAAAAVIVYLVWNVGLVENILGKKAVDFTMLEKDEIPQTIEKDVIPEYRDLERALGCLVNGKVYVIVTRGEKPTAGYDVTIESIIMEKKDDKQNMRVKALFTEPPEGIAVSQVITYPYGVAETELTILPDTIELIAGYE